MRHLQLNICYIFPFLHIYKKCTATDKKCYVRAWYPFGIFSYLLQKVLTVNNVESAIAHNKMKFCCISKNTPCLTALHTNQQSKVKSDNGPSSR